MKNLINQVLYGGYSKEEFRKHSDTLLKKDIRNLSVYLIIAGTGFLLLGLVSMLTGGFTRVNVRIYLYTSAAFWVTWLVLKACTGRGKTITPANGVFIYVFIAILYAESIAITAQHSSMPAVTCIGVMLVLPLLFARNTLIMCLFQCVFAAAFCVCVKCNKLPEIASVDIWNGLTFLIVSIAAIIRVTPMRIRQEIQHEIVARLYVTDLLTGLRNRNSYEDDCKTIEKAERKPVCVYADANGLHELNNLHGHEAGDKMLLTVAEELRQAFGTNNAYRIGGDEFVAFVFDESAEQCREKALQMTERLAKQGYHVSLGVSAPEEQSETLDSIIKKAERFMYDAKTEYYRTSGTERRRR